jgi:hypothetical protein
MSVTVRSWLQSVAAFVSEGFVGRQGHGGRQRRRRRIAAFSAPVFAATENLERRQLLAAADISVISVSGDPGDSVELPVRVTRWDDLGPEESLLSFDVFLTYDSLRLDLASTDIGLGSLFAANGWTITAEVNEPEGLVSIFADAPTGNPTPVPDALPDLVLLNFSISPGASSGAALVTLSQDPTNYTSLYNGDDVGFVTNILSGQGGGGGPDGPVENNDPTPGVTGFSTDEDTPFITGNVLNNDSDPNNGALSIFSFSQPMRGPEPLGKLESLGDGTFLFTPGKDFDGLSVDQTENVSFEYQIENQFGQRSAPATVVITVFGVNDTPKISSISNQTMLEDSKLSNLSFTVSDPDHATLAVQAASDNPTLFPDGSLSLSGSGENRLLSVEPAANLFGQATITLTVSDGVSSSTTTFVVTVQAVNDPPQISSFTGQSTAEDTPILNIPFTISDIDSQNLTLDITATGSVLSLESFNFSGSGSNRFLSIYPERDRSGQATVTVTVTDGAFTASSSFDVFVNAVNDPPVIDFIADQTTAEDVPITGLQLIVFDVDNEFSITASTTNPLLLPAGSVVISPGPERTLTINPTANVFGTSDVTLTANDGQASTSRTFRVTVNSVSDTPTISTISNQTVPEDGVLSNIPFTIFDGDGDPLSLSFATSNPVLLPLAQITSSGTGNDRQLSITPASGLSGSATVTVSVTDGQTTSSTTFTVQVTPVNDPPTISPIADQSVNEDDSLSGITFSVADEDSPTLTVSATSTNSVLLPPGSLTVTGTGNTRQLTISPAANRFGTAVITVTVSDGSAAAASTLNLTVNSINDPPTAAPDFEDYRYDNLSFVVIDVLGNDSDIDGTLDPSTLEIVTYPSSGIAEVSQGKLVFYGASNPGLVTFTYRVRDNDSAFSDPVVVSVNVSTNVPPVIQPIPAQSLFVGGSGIQLPVTVIDPDGGGLMCRVFTDTPELFSSLGISDPPSAPILTLTPGTRPGRARVTVEAWDSIAAPVSYTFDVTVGLIIDAGAARPGAGVMTHRGYANSVAVPFSSSAAVTGVPEGIPASLFRTNVFDNPGRPDLLFSIPTISGQAYEVDLLFAEIWSGGWGVGRRVFDVMLENSLAIDNLDVFAAAGRNRALMRTFEVTGDGNLSIEFQRVVQNPNISGIRVRPLSNPNTPPTITPITAQQTSEDTAITGIEFTVADAEGQPLTVSVSSSNSELVPAAGLLLSGSGAARQLSITPAQNRFGTAQVTVSVTDGQATTSSSFNVTVNSVNDLPVAVADEATTRTNTAVIISVLTNDSDIDGTLNAASLAITSQSPNGVAVPNADGTIQFSPNTGFSGNATFSYSVRDNDGGESQPATVSVLVRNNAPPMISEIPAIQLNVGTSSAPIAFQVTDDDGDSLTVTATAADTSIVRTVAVTGSGNNRQLTITAGSLLGLTSVTISVSDGVNPPVTRTIPVSVSALIDVGSAQPTAGALPDAAFQNGAGLRFSGNLPVVTAPGTLAASVPDLFYRSTLFDPSGGKDLEFDVHASAGQMFAVDLFFAEVWSGAFRQGRRVFDVNIDGNTVLKDFDVFKEAGGANIGIARRFVIQSDGRIDIDLRRVIQNPMLSGLRITPLGPPSPT